MMRRWLIVMVGVALVAQPALASARPLCRKTPQRHACCCPTSSGAPCTMACGDHAAADSLAAAPSARLLLNRDVVSAVVPDTAPAVFASRANAVPAWRAHAPPTRLYLLACILRL